MNNMGSHAQGNMFPIGYRSKAMVGKHQEQNKRIGKDYFLSDFFLFLCYLICGFFIGTYSLNNMVTENLVLLQKDQDQSEKFIYVNNFLTDIFATLSLSAFTSNSMLAASLSTPSWSSTQCDGSQNSLIFGTNCVLACDGFRNTKHTDRD